MIGWKKKILNDFILINKHKTTFTILKNVHIRIQDWSSSWIKVMLGSRYQFVGEQIDLGFVNCETWRIRNCYKNDKEKLRD